MEFSPAVVKRSAGQIGKHSPVPFNHGWHQLRDHHPGILAKDVQRRSHRVAHSQTANQNAGPRPFCQVLTAQSGHGFF